ncbi:putative ABC transport system substrate-binding protein [Rhizobiales bacterium GAS188]|nr:putative ABC transport system substrate-binding protein [Rhizobiales bacterium GAS188]
MNRSRRLTLWLAGLGALAAATAGQAAGMKKIAISSVVEVPQLLETKEGVLKGLAEKGFVEGKDITVEYQSANGNTATQQQIARKFVGDAPDVIVAITTPTAQAMAAATKDIPIVFATVTDPVKAKLIAQYQAPGGNVTGVSDAAPIVEQLKLFREILPKLKKLGFVYNPGLDSSLANLGWLREAAAPLGIEVVESTAPTSNEVIAAANKLVGRVDAIYIPNDTTVVAALETIVKIGQDTKTPIFTGETRGVDRGALASLGLDYIEVGRLAGHMVAEVLKGKKPGEIDAVIAYTKLPVFNVVINKGSAAAMGVSLPEAVLAHATKVVN